MGDNNNKVAVMSDGVKTLDGMTGNTRYVIYDGKGKKMSAPKDKVDSKGFAAYAAKLPGGTVELVKGNDVFNVPLDEAEAAIADGMRPFTFFKAGKNQPKKKDWNAYKTRTVDAGISKIQEEGQPAGYDPNNKWFVPDWNKPQDMTMWAEPTWMQQAEDDGYTRNAADDRKMAALGNAINTTSQAVADTYNVTMDDGSKMPDLSGKPSLDIKRYDLGSAAPDIIDDTAKKIAADRSYDAVMGRTNYDIHRRIKSGYEKSMRADEAKKKKENQIFSVLGGMRNPMTGAINGGTDRNKSAETKMYEAASLFMDRAEKMQSAAADNAGFWRGAKDKATDINTWTGGVADLNQMAALATALNKADKGGKLNTAEQTLLDAAAYYTQAAMDADDKLSTWYNVGSGVVESAPFMLEFMVNPIGGGSKALAKQMIKYTAKQFGKHLTNKAVRKAVQIGARQAAAVASGAAMAGTTGMPAVMADTYRRMNGKAMGAIGGDGALTFDQAVERDGFGEALKKSFAARTIENWTETAGWFDEILPVMGKYLKGSKLATKIMDSGLGKGMSKMFDKAANSKSGRLLKEGAEYIDNSVLGHAVKNVQDRVHFSGNIGETLEEFQGSIANSIVVGDQKLDTSKEGVFNRDNMIQTFLTCSVISGAMQAPSVVAGAYKGLSDYDYVKASNNARRVIGSQWDGVRQALQDASNKDRVQFLHNVLRSAAYSAEDKKAIMMYVGALAKHEASRFFRNATRLNNEQYAYRNRKKIIEEFEQSKQGLTDEDLQALDQYDNFEELDRQTDISRDPERAVQIERYMEAREDMYYYIDAMNRHISDRVNSRYQEMQGDINQDMGGRVVAQSNYSGGDVVVTGGRLAINEDGSVDKANSDKVIYYRDRDGRVHMSTPDMFSAASVTSEADIKAQLETEEREAEDMLEDEELNGGTAGGSVISGDGGAAVSGDTGDGGVNGVAGAVPGVPSAGTTAAGTTAAGTVGTPVEASADQQSAQPVSGGASVGSGYTAQVGDAVTAGGRDGVVVSVYDDEVIVNHGGSEYRSYSLDAVAPTQSTEQGATAGNSSNGQVATEMNSATQPTQPSQPVEATQAMPADAAGAVGVANGGDVAGGSAGDVTPGDAGSIAPGVDAAPEASVQMPMTDKGEEDFAQVAPNATLDYLREQGMSEEDIAEYVALQIKAAEAEVAKAGKAKTSTNLKKFKEAKSKAAEAKAKLDYWNQVGGLMQTGAEQVAEADTDTGIADGATTGSTGNTVADGTGTGNAGNAADGAVPDVVMDNAADARARGYRMVMGEKVSRQEFVPGVVGNDVSVRFGNGANDAVQGNYVVVDAGSIQPSHKGGVRNHSFFLDEAQPKDRRDDASVMAAEAMANNMRPQEITEGVTAYTGAPVVNSRGEVIQGNNRSAALIQMHEQNGAEADKYKQYLVDHAEQFGVDADTVAGMEYPVLVRMVDVEDAEAIRLGNMTAQDTESGGVERIKPQQSYTRLGDKVRSFMRLLLDSVEEDQSYSEVIAQNAVTALKFLADHGAISNTQYQSAFDANGNVTAEAKLDLKEMAEFNLFEGGAQELPRMFRALPARVQKAILQTFMRDADSAEADRIKGDIQNAIVLFDRAMAYSPEFRSAKDYESAKRALFVYGLQGSLIEGDKPAKDLFDNFAFELAARFRSMTQKGMVQMFQAFYDKVQGAGMDLFHPDAKPMSKADAVRDVFNVELNKANDHEQKNENDVGNDTGDGETGRPGISADDRSGGETSQGNGNAESDGGVADGRTDVDNQGNPLKSDGSLQVESVSSIDELTDEDFLSPVRNVVLPSLPSKVDAALGINGRPIVIKKNIFERNSQRHSDLTAEDSRRILNSALYNPDMYGQNQKRKRPYNWIVINTKDEKGHNRTVVIEVNENKDSVEIVHWHYVDERGLAKIRRQAANEDGQLLILPSVTEEAGALSSPIHDLSVGKDNSSVSEKQKDVDKNVSGGVSEYRYGMTVRPFGIGNQPDGALRHEDGGGAYGTVVYDHPLTEEEAKNFNLTPLTEAESLVGKRFSYELGGHTLYCEVLSAENGRVRFSVNGNSEMVWDYYEFMHKMKPVEESVSDSGVASEDASENENGGSENESLNDSDSEVGVDNTTNGGRASVREEVRESQRTPLKMRKMVEAVCDKLGLKVQWHDTLHANGYYDPDTRTVHIARDAVHPLRMVFGHEVTHAVKLMNPKAYDKLRDAVKKLMGEAEFAGSTRQKKLDYEYEGYTGYEIDYYEEEVVCDEVGLMLDSNVMAENLCRLINDRSVLSALKRAVRRVFEAVISVARMNNREQRAMLRLQHAIEDAIRNTDGNVDSAEENGDRFSLRDGKPVMISPLEMSEEEKRQRGELLHNAQSIDVASNQIMKTERLTARKAAEAWWDNHISKPLFFDTEVGLVEIDKSSIKDSLSHGYRQEKLDAITSLPRGFKHAIYIGSMKDFNRLGVMNHYFAYPIRYNNQRRYVFCRAMADNNKNRLYVHEVFMGNSIKESDTLQTIASASSDDELHGGVALYKAVLKNILDTTNVDNDFTKSKSDAVNNAKGERFSLRDGSSRVNPNKVPNSSSVDADEFAAKHHLNLNDVKKYADAMKSGNLGGASYAFKNIKRSVLLANEGLSMSQFLKVFNPIKKDLFGSFGSVEELRNEHIEAELERRNVMEAARKREEAEKEAERERLKEFELMSDEALDEAYMEAVRNNDEQRMRDFVNEAARRKGYQSADEFRMSHRAPSYDEDGTDKSLIDVANNKDNIRDSLEDHFRMNRDKNREESIAAIRQAIQEIEKGNIPNVTIYRAVPKSLKEGSVRNGDWITLSESYAKQHGNHALNGEYRIMKEVVPADNLYWDGNDINEWGYDDKSDYVYRNTKNNRKLNELVVRDDKGEIIPLSKRFNSRKKDVRFSLIGTKGAAALDKAEEASVRLDNLAVAREMEATGKDAKTVKMATGWERGADGKWRYEVQDFDVDVHGMARRNHLHDKLPWGKEYEAMVDKLFSDEMLTAEEEVRFDELSSLAQNLQETYEKTETRYLDDYVMDRSLFKAYPELRQVRVEMYNDPWSLVGATWYGSADLVRINEAKFDTQDLRSILIHEVQHAIQDIEGFARGGNESTYRNLLAGLREKHDSWAVIEEFEDKSKELGSDVQPIDVYYAVIDEYQSLGIEFGDGFAPSREAFDNGFNLWLRGYDNEGYEDAYNEYQRLVGKFGFGEGDSRYNQLAGEVEARNVQKRMDMTAEERRNSLASETEDVAREDQIFIMEHAGSSEMGSRVNRHMAEIGKRFDKEDLDSNQRAVVDVYSGKKNNETVTVKRADGNRKIVMRQGTENKAGTKHSLYRHYGRSEGEITVDDVILIPEILRDGERISTKNGKGFVYSLEKGGIRYRVLTETVNQKEVFCDFYTNKKRKQYSRVNNHEVDTQLSAHTDNITSFSDAKIDSNSESSSSDAVNNAKGDRFSLRDAGVSGERNLVAVHNISEEKLKQAFELGGFPMPSIAITKADMGHGEFGEISLVFGRETVDPSDSQNKVYGEDAWTPVFPSIGYKLDEDKALSIYRKTNEASDLPLFESFRFHPENLVDRVGRNGVQDLVEYFRDSYEAKQLYLHDKGNAVTEYEKQKGEKYSAENIAFYDKILEEIGLDRLKNDKDNVQDAVKQAMVKYLGTDFENMRPRMVLPYVNSAIYNAVDYAENGNEKTGKDIKATQEKIDSRINQKDFEKWLTELFDGIIEKRGIRNEKDPYTSSGNRRKWEQLYDAVTLDNILKNMRKQPKRGGSGMFNGSPFGAAQREYRSMEEIRKDAEKRIRTVDAQEFESQRNAIAERFFSVVIPGVDGFSARADMTETLIEAVAHSHTARGIYNYLKKYYPEVTMDVAKELADIVKDIQQLSARYFESKPYRAVGFDEVRLAVVPSDTDAAVVDRLKSMGIEVRPYERGNESERSAIVRDVTKERDLRFSLRGSKNTVATDSYSSHARLTKRQVQKVFGGIWIADKQEFAKFASAVNNHGVEHDGEGSVYTDNYFYLYYYNIDGVPIPYVSVYLNDEKSQELVNRLQDDNVTRRLGRRMQVSYSRSSALLRDEPRKSNRDSGDYSSLRGRKRNDRIYRKLLRQGRYVYNPSLYVKTGRGYEGLPDRGGRGGLEDKGSRFSLRGTSSVVERAENGCLKNLLGEEFSGSVNGLYGVLPTVARERIREQVLREVMDFSDMERAAVRMADVSADTLGYLASENPDADWWEPVCERMRNALKNAGVAEELNDNDVRYLLWANGGKNGDAPMAQPIPSSKGNEIEGVRNSVGELEHLDPKDMIEGVRFSLRVADIDREDFESMIRHDRFREGWQDAMISVRRFQDELERASGVALQDYENAYDYENTVGGRVVWLRDQFDRDFMEPIHEAVANFGGGVEMEEAVRDYLKAKHGLERNRVMRQKEIDLLRQKLTAEAVKANKGGALTQAQMDAINDKVDKLKDKLHERDFSGLGALHARLNGLDHIESMTTVEMEMAQWVDDFEQQNGRNKTDGLWDAVHNANNHLLDFLVKTGMLSRDDRDQIRDQYDYYVPLREWQGDKAGDHYEYLMSRGTGVFADPLRTAKGRKSESGDPLAMMKVMALSTFLMGEKNETKLRLLRMVRNRPNNLAKISQVWYVQDATGQWSEAAPTITDTMSDADVEQAVNDFEQQMTLLEQAGVAVRERNKLDLGMHVIRTQASEHAVKVKEMGKEYTIYFNTDPRVAQAINGMNKVRTKYTGVAGMYAGVKRYMTAAMTSYNPTFALANLVRDFQSSITNAYIKDGAKHAVRVVALVPKAFWELNQYLRKGKLSPRLKEFLSNGGETGYAALQQYDKAMEELNRAVGLYKKRGRIKEFLRAVNFTVQQVNRNIENTMRYSTYMACRESGMSILQSIKDAKNSSTNFDRRGSGALGAQMANMWFYFLNPSIQTLHYKSHLWKDKTWRSALAKGFWWSLSVLVPAFLWGEDDDEYAEIPDHVKRNNICIPGGRFGVITIPLSYDVKTVYTLGDICRSWSRGEYKEDGDKAVLDALLCLSEVMPVNLLERSKSLEEIPRRAMENLSPDCAIRVAAERAELSGPYSRALNLIDFPIGRFRIVLVTEIFRTKYLLFSVVSLFILCCFCIFAS